MTEEFRYYVSNPYLRSHPIFDSDSEDVTVFVRHNNQMMLK